MIPQPRYVKYTGGAAGKDILVREIYSAQLEAEEYRIRIAEDEIVIEGRGETELFYAHTTLEQLKMINDGVLPCGEIMDKPVYPYRSFQIDCARHYISVEELKKMIHMSAEFKLNRFHWHISDDQGWRIESRCYPRLHEIGSLRAGDHFGNYDSDEEEGGYYSREEVREIVSYCKQFGIEVVPEIDMPGHVTAILAAYPELSCTGEPMRVGMKAGIYKDIFCAGKEETFTFIENMLDELLELFPGKYIHIGGDEAPKERWKMCPRCKKRMEEEGLRNVQELQGYFENRIADYLIQKGRIPIVWNEAVYGGNLAADTTVQIWTEDKENKVKAHLDKGGNAIISIVENCYCDYPYGQHSLKDVYSLNMLPPELGERGEDSVIGTECLVWTEFIRDSKRLEELCWPRFAASAEVGWCGVKRPGYEEFAGRLRKLFPTFEKNGITATVEDGWVPDEKTAAEQIAAFRLNFPEEEMEEVRRAQADI